MKNMNWFFKIVIIFTILVIGSVAKSQSPDSLIGKIVASDPDMGQTLTYQIVSGNENNIFNLNANTGLLYWHNKPVGIITEKKYVLIIKVTDNGIPPLSSQAKCIIQLIPNKSKLKII
jgi:hypothetical protein